MKTAGKGKHNISRECSVLCTRKTCGGTRLHPPELTSHILVMTVAPHVHREYRHVRPWRKLLGGVSLSPRGTGQIFRFPGKRIGNVSPPFRQRPDRQRTSILLLFVSNPTRPHPNMRTVLSVLLQTETSRKEDTILRSNCYHCTLSCIVIVVMIECIELNKQSNC